MNCVLVPADHDDLPVLSLARGSETTRLASNERNTPMDKKPKKEVFYKGRNFK